MSNACGCEMIVGRLFMVAELCISCPLSAELTLVVCINSLSSITHRFLQNRSLCSEKMVSTLKWLLLQFYSFFIRLSLSCGYLFETRECHYLYGLAVHNIHCSYMVFLIHWLCVIIDRHMFVKRELDALFGAYMQKRFGGLNYVEPIHLYKIVENAIPWLSICLFCDCNG